ncbi:MAG: response regulator [Candidatus Auribacter fodinae]|uniref:histidine kinase n=1 Tax=Candidatus Auribacter fodinae TaxID=2093366 RepID=A0A3A4R6P0_9BACT|nr:MAG: response regulator [Candidatus Auribacter fodinae]
MPNNTHNQKFSSYLIGVMVTFVAITLALIFGILYGILSQSISSDFHKKLHLDESDISIVLQTKTNLIDTQLRNLAFDNSIKVSLLLGMKQQVEEQLEKQYHPHNGIYFFVHEPSFNRFIPEIPEHLSNVSKCLKNLSNNNLSKKEFHQCHGKYISLYSIPIMQKDSILGMAFAVYVIAEDQEFWQKFEEKHDASLLHKNNDTIRDLKTNTHLKSVFSRRMLKNFNSIDDNELDSHLANRNSVFIPVRNFPGVVYAASNEPLYAKRRHLTLVFAGLGTVVIILSLLVASLIATRMSEPLRAMADQASAIAQDPSCSSINESRIKYQEFKTLARSFNTLLEDLTESQNSLKQHRDNLEELVAERTQELNASNIHLQQEITERAKTEEQLAIFKKFAELSTVGFRMAELNGTITYCNPAMVEMLDAVVTAELMGKNIRCFYDENELALLENEIIPVTLEQGQWTGEVNIKSISGRVIPTIQNSFIIYNNQNEPLYLANVITDIARLKALEEQLTQAQKLEAIGQLAGGVAHDFNNILTGILGYANLITMTTKPEETVYRSAQTIENAAKRARDLTQQLLGFARKGKFQIVTVDMNESIKEAVTLMARTVDKKVVMSSDLRATRPAILGDPGQIQQILINLSLNAQHAMPDGGELVFSTENVTLTSEYCKRHPGAIKGDFLVLSVSDTGCGMSKEIQQRIFEPFFTTKKQGEGTGMGLAMVYGIVRNHGGSISVYSEPGEGSVFKLYFPVAPAAKETARANTSEGIVSGSGTILIVDDEKFVREVACEMLQYIGYTVVSFSNAKEALEYYQEHADEIDLVLLDMVMPEINGKDCFDAMKKINPGVKAILSTGYGKDGKAQEILNNGASGYVQKPYMINQLSEEVARVIGV